MPTVWARFWKWYDKHILKTLLVSFVILTIQIPHFFWAGDMLMNVGVLAKQNIFLDSFLYSIDLLEIPLIVNTGMQVYARYVNKFSKNSKHT